MTNSLSAIVVGCGLAGPVAALALARAGYAVTIHEARSSSTEGGVFLNLASNGLAALQTLGLDRAAASAGFATPQMTMWSGSGKKLGDVANGMTLADGTSSVTVRREALHRALREEAERRGISILEGRRLVSAESLAGGVSVAHFDDGSSLTADLIVGADGLWSRTRQTIDAAAPPPRYSGMLSIGGFANVPELAPTPQTFRGAYAWRAVGDFDRGLARSSPRAVRG
ncbi:MAG: monooxygenase, FAD-binding protein [Labilithrix sp.]|nr:monooxygenase, FAD-binding protein [Labilithrix sp.]